MSLAVETAFGDELKKLRRKVGKTQQQVAIECDMSLRFYQYLEKGTRMPSLITVFRIADSMGITPEQLTKNVWAAWKKSKKGIASNGFITSDSRQSD